MEHKRTVKNSVGSDTEHQPVIANEVKQSPPRYQGTASFLAVTGCAILRSAAKQSPCYKSNFKKYIMNSYKSPPRFALWLLRLLVDRENANSLL
ncbi:MAG: hypothetical protein ACE5I1_06635, partial [bacterium]